MSDIGAAGGYGGVNPRRQQYDALDGQFEVALKQFDALRYNPYDPSRERFERLGLDVDKLPLYVGNKDLRDYIYSLDDDGLSRLDQLYDWKKGMFDTYGGRFNSREEYENYWNEAAKKHADNGESEAADRARSVPVKHPYGSPVFLSELPREYSRDLPLDVRRDLLYKMYNDTFSHYALDSVAKDYDSATGLVRDKNRVMRLIDDPRHAWLPPDGVEMSKRFNRPYVDAAYDTYQKYLDAGEAKKNEVKEIADRLNSAAQSSDDGSAGPYVGYDPALQEKHYNELLRLFDEVGPHMFMPNTLLGRDALYHPVGGLVPNAERMYTTYMPYFMADPDLLSKIDNASGGLVSKGKQDFAEKSDK